MIKVVTVGAEHFTNLSYDSLWDPFIYASNLNDYISSLPLNNGFLCAVQENGHEIRDILSCDSPPQELKDALFVIDLNGFRDDLKIIIDILDDNKKYIEIKVHLENVLNDQEVRIKEFIKRAEKFYTWAYDYKEFKNRHLYPGKKLPIYRCLLRPLGYLPCFYKEENNVLENAQRAEKTFQDCYKYFKNFVNALYGDADEGEKFLGLQFQEVSNEYIWLAVEWESLKKLVASVVDEWESASNKINNLDEKRYKILCRHPAIVFRSIDEITKYMANKKEKFSPRRSG